mmetsp:Transcript_8713/g.15966  ORF Transcript_8713/g.15966 Transcript_8713/m.15966 type:complete len:231 (-) Transcript_8713:287-979(-)
MTIEFRLGLLLDRNVCALNAEEAPRSTKTDSSATGFAHAQTCRRLPEDDLPVRRCSFASISSTLASCKPSDVCDSLSTPAAATSTATPSLASKPASSIAAGGITSSISTSCVRGSSRILLKAWAALSACSNARSWASDSACAAISAKGTETNTLSSLPAFQMTRLPNCQGSMSPTAATKPIQPVTETLSREDVTAARITKALHIDPITTRFRAKSLHILCLRGIHLTSYR